MEIEAGLEAKVENLMAKYPASLAGHLGVDFIKVTRSRLEAKMPVDERTKQPFGLLHGGASVALAETLASVGGWLNVDDSLFAVVGAEINANHLRPVTEGSVHAVACPIHLGKKIQVWEIRISDQSDRLTCISRCTLAVVTKKSGT